MLQRWIDNDGVVDLGISVLNNLAGSADSRQCLLSHVPLVVALMNRWPQTLKVARSGVFILSQLAINLDNLPALRAAGAAAAVRGALARHDDNGIQTMGALMVMVFS